MYKFGKEEGNYNMQVYTAVLYNQKSSSCIMSKEQTISIDNVEYPVSGLTDKAKSILNNLQFIDNEIARLNTMLAVNKTAASTYVQALKKELQQPSAQIGKPVAEKIFLNSVCAP